MDRSTPCPNVKHGDDWGDPAQCDSGENCPYCHTRTEQQFHPEVLKRIIFNNEQSSISFYDVYLTMQDGGFNATSHVLVIFFAQIYKSTKCNDMVQTGYCPRGPFCAFAHVERKYRVALVLP